MRLAAAVRHTKCERETEGKKLQGQTTTRLYGQIIPPRWFQSPMKVNQTVELPPLLAVWPDPRIPQRQSAGYHPEHSQHSHSL